MIIKFKSKFLDNYGHLLRPDETRGCQSWKARHTNRNERPKIDAEDHRIHFQVSGIKVEFDNNPDNPIVESIKTACKIEKDCSLFLLFSNLLKESVT